MTRHFSERRSCVAHLRVLLVSLVAATSIGASPALAQSTDSLAAAHPTLFTRTDLYYLGGFALATAALAPVDKQLAQELRESDNQTNRFLHDSATGFRLLGNPGVIVISGAMYGAGRILQRPELADVGLHTAESLVLAGVITDAVKSLAGRARPRVDPDHPYNFQLGRGWPNRNDYMSFPSGHTSAAFATASALSAELGRLYPHESWIIRPLLYGGAGLVGLSRMYNNAHWASDVVVGAAIGTFSGWKVVRYNHAHPDNRVDRFFLGRLAREASATPTPDGGLVLTWRF